MQRQYDDIYQTVLVFMLLYPTFRFSLSHSDVSVSQIKKFILQFIHSNLQEFTTNQTEIFESIFLN